jgi:hypothetical protein
MFPQSYFPPNYFPPSYFPSGVIQGEYAGPLLHSPADVLRWVLVQATSLGDPTVTPLPDWPGYESREPSLPDNCVTLYDTEPRDDGRSQIDGEREVHYGVQVRVRGRDKKTAAGKAWALVDALNEDIYFDVVTVPPEGTQYRVYSVSNAVGPLFIGRDSPTTDRSLYTINCFLTLDRISA